MNKIRNIIKKEIYSVLKEEVSSKVKGYNYSVGERVTLKHKSWPTPRTMVVSRPGTTPELKLGAITIDFGIINMKDFDFIVPDKIKSDIEKENNLEYNKFFKKVRKNRLYGKERERVESQLSDLEFDLISLKQELKELRQDVSDTMKEMEISAGDYIQQHGSLDDTFGNEWGKKLNDIDDEINVKKLEIKKVEQRKDALEAKLDA